MIQTQVLWFESEVKKKGSWCLSGALLYLLGILSRSGSPDYFKREKASCLYSLVLLLRNGLRYYGEREKAACLPARSLAYSNIDPQHHGIDPQTYRSSDL